MFCSGFYIYRMKKLFLLPLLLITAASSFAAVGDTTVIVAHTLSNMASPPSNDDIWTVFPNTSTTYQRVVMKFTLGCGTPNCSGWDYTVNASLGKKSGTLDSSIVSIDTLTHDTVWNYTDHVNFIEVGRLITPYGTYMAAGSNGFNNAWTHPYYYDVTDYAALLKDSVNVRVHYDGWTDAFSARVEFIFIEGVPTRQVETVREIYNTYIGYPNSAGFESVADAKTFPIAANVTSAKLVLIMTGHGNQGEFDPHYIHWKVNSNEIYSRILWKDDCDVTAVAPQGGTWVFSRANWCPGEKIPVFETDITPYITPGQNVLLDLDFDDFTIQSGASAGYGVSAHLVTYTSQKDNDVMMEEIIAPNNDKPYVHWNPISTTPKVKIKNTGKSTLNYAEISYWVKGGTKWYYEWYGALPSFESELITLPAFDWNGLDTNDRVFYAEAKWPNQVPDEYEFNNKIESKFNMAPKLDSAFFIFFKSNNQPWENKYVVLNEAGDTIRYKTTFAATTNNFDTLRLQPGSYAFDFFDFDSISWGCGDGLSFFLNQNPQACPVGSSCYETNGQLKLRRLNNTSIKDFSTELGRNTHYEFTVGYPLGYNPPKQAPNPPVHTGVSEVNNVSATMNVFPNPAHDVINIEIDLSQKENGLVDVRDITGKLLKQFTVTDVRHYKLSLSSAEFAKGVYFVNFSSKTTRVAKKVVVE